MTRQTVRYTILSVLTLLSGYLYVVANAQVPQRVLEKHPPIINVSTEEQLTLDYLNQLRIHAGLVPLQKSQPLTQSAKNHAHYLILNQKIGHYEDKNNQGYTGTYGAQRSIHCGYKSALIIENVSNNNLDHQASIDGLMSAIYHRFGFLDFHINEIGIGILQNLTNPYQTAFVYDMGNQELNRLCHESNQSTPKNPIKEVCSDPKKDLSQKDFFKAIYSNRTQNSPVVLYPYPNQHNIPPAFYDELPDPLPEHLVSGFPISLSFDESRFKHVELLNFRLFDPNGEEIKEVLIYNHQNDPNKRLKKFEFALFPLQRLEWASQYHLQATYRIDGKLEEKKWSFTTQSFNLPLHTVTPTDHHFKMSQGDEMIFYFPPQSKTDTLQSLRYPRNLDINFIDKNTIKIKALYPLTQRITLKMGHHQLILSNEAT